MLRKILVLFSIFGLPVVWATAQSCSDYNYQGDLIFWDPVGTQEHTGSGNHSFYSSLTSSCTHSSTGSQTCATGCSAYGSISNTDTGRLTTVNPLYQHNPGNQVNGGYAGSGAGPASCGATAAATVSGSLDLRRLVRNRRRHQTRPRQLRHRPDHLCLIVEEPRPAVRG